MMSPASDVKGMEAGQSTPTSESQPMSSLEVEQPLPSVAELTGRTQGEEPSNRRRSDILVPILLILVVVLLSLSIGLGLGLKEAEDSNAKEIDDQKQQETVEAVVDLQKRYNEIVRFLSESEVSHLADLESDGSPQKLAATFIAFLDPLLLEIPHSHVVRDGYTFVTRYILMVLFFSTNGDEWTNLRNFRSKLPTCQWWEVNLDESTSHLYKYTGVICNERGIITNLLLPDSKLKGTLPTELGLLFSLKSIVLNKNRLSGSIPASFEKLINLQDLWVGDNSLTGLFPAWISNLIGLRSLDISYNRMAGALPIELGSLAYVEMLALDNNLFSGRVDSVFNLKSNSYGGLKKLKYLYLEGNHFSGPIGDDFMYRGDSSQIASPLVALDLSYNSFSGTLPSHIFSGFPYLRVFDGSGNMLTGKLPQDMVPNESMTFLSLQGNSLTGEVSGLLPELQRLTHLDVSSNEFTGWHIDLGALSSLTYLFLAENPFPSGPFPDFLNSLTNLEELSLKSTLRTGTIPTYLSKMNQLVLLDLDDNQFTGNIPTQLGSLSLLQFLLLNRNQLSGSVPSEFQDLSALRLLFLDNNDLTGDLDPVCSGVDPFVIADCAGDGQQQAPVSCFCCDKCCSKNEPCNDENFIPSKDAAWQFGYERFYYWFGGDEGYEISDVPP